MQINKLILTLLATTITTASAGTPPTKLAGQMMMIGFTGVSVDDQSPIVKAIKNYHIGGVILVPHHAPGSKHITTNVQSPEQLEKLISQLQFYAKKYHNYPLFIAVNQEGGQINTLKSTQGFPTANDPSEKALKIQTNEIYSATLKRAYLLKKIGINLNLAPVVDLDINPDNPGVGKLERSFGSDPAVVTSDLKQVVKAYKKANVFCTFKHFPGLGSADSNTDYDSADVSKTWTTRELLPYKELFKNNNGCDFVMVGHMINTQLSNEPASLSYKVVTQLLREKLGFKGLVITDDMDAAAIRNHYQPKEAIEKAVLAGNDIIIYGGTQGYSPEADTQLLFNTLLQLAKTNKQANQQMLRAYKKIKYIKSI